MVFRVPLHANERFGAFDADGFDLAVFSHRFYPPQTLTDTQYAGRKINPHLSHAVNTMQDATFSQGNAMNRGVADIVFFIRLAVIPSPSTSCTSSRAVTIPLLRSFPEYRDKYRVPNTAGNRRRRINGKTVASRSLSSRPAASPFSP